MMGLGNMIRRALMPPQPNGGIKKRLAQADKERAVRVKSHTRSIKDGVVRVKKHVRALQARDKSYWKQVEDDVRRLAAHITGTSVKEARKKTSSGKKSPSRRSGPRSGKRVGWQ